MAAYLIHAAIAGSLTFASASGPAAAQGPSYDYCVACEKPAATYLCTVGPREPDPGAAAWASYCAERARVDMGHASCAARSLGGDCRATRALVFRGARATREQAEALTSDNPELRTSAAAQIWVQTVRGMQQVGETMGENAEIVGGAAQTVGEEVWTGLKTLGDNLSRGTECVLSMGDRC